MELTHTQSSWRTQQRLVRMWLIPIPAMVAYLLYWHAAKLPGYPPLWVWAVLFGSIGFCLFFALVFWRCPACGNLLFRTSKSGAGVLFWLADPDDCPDCGVSLQPRPPSTN